MTTGNSSAIFGNPLGQTPAAIINSISSGGWAGWPVSAAQARWCKATTSGALTANTLKTVLSVTGAGVLYFVGVSTVDTTSRTMRLVITLDGQATPAFDSTSAAITVANTAGFAVGNMDGNNAYSPAPQEIPFSTSCLIQIASSVSETDKMNVFLLYRTN